MSSDDDQRPDYLEWVQQAFDDDASMGSSRDDISALTVPSTPRSSTTTDSCAVFKSYLEGNPVPDAPTTEDSSSADNFGPTETNVNQTPSSSSSPEALDHFQDETEERKQKASEFASNPTLSVIARLSSHAIKETYPNAVFFKIDHPATEKWRDIVREFSSDQDTYPR
jgi:hypothetical protein